MPRIEITKKLARLEKTLAFFAGLEQMAGEMGKDVIVFDPFTMEPEGASSMEQLQTLNAQLLGFKAVVLTAIPGTVGTAGGFFAVKDAVSGKHSRRAFLTGLASAAAVGFAGSMVMGGIQENRRAQTSSTLDNPNPLSPTLLDFIDYRNAAVAKVFTTLADNGELDLKVAAVYGDAHRAQMRYYFEHPAQRDSKLSTVYTSMVEAAPPRYRRFKYGGNNSWTKTQDRVIKK